MGPESSADGGAAAPHWFKATASLLDEGRTFKGRYTLAVWLAYLHCANSKSRLAWPSKQTVAEFVGCKIRAVQRSVAELLQRGLMREDGMEVFGKVAVTRYFVPCLSTPVQPDRGASTEALTPVQPDALPLSGQTPKQEHKKNKKTERHKTRAHTHAKTPAPPGDVSVAALALDVERPAPSSRRIAASGEADDQAAIKALLEAGVHASTRNPWKATASLVHDYRRRWPDSDPSAWIQFAAFQQLTGPVKTRAAWIATHLNGYARKGWHPTNRDGSPRLWHQAILQGRYDDARKFAGLEVSYAPERLSESRKAKQEPAAVTSRPSAHPRSLAEILQSTAII